MQLRPIFPQVHDDIAVINLELPYATKDALIMLKEGHNVVLFGDERCLSLNDELKIKKFAKNNNLLVVTPHSYAHMVELGNIGIVGTAGTAIQEVSALIDQKGFGVSKAISTGSRDLDEKIGGLQTKYGLHVLNNDRKTKVIILILKPASSKMHRSIFDEIKSIDKPVISYVMRGDSKMIKSSGAIMTNSLEDVVHQAILSVKTKPLKKRSLLFNDSILKTQIMNEQKKLHSSQQFIRGIFSGGSICNESLLILESNLNKVYSNVPNAKFLINNNLKKNCHICMDMGHDTNDIPMTTPFRKNSIILRELLNPTLSVLLTDVILGHGAHLDPAGKLAETISIAKKRIGTKRHVSIIVSLIGTNNDPQKIKSQMKKLMDVGIIVAPTSTKAAQTALAISKRIQK